MLKLQYDIPQNPALIIEAPTLLRLNLVVFKPFGKQVTQLQTGAFRLVLSPQPNIGALY